MELGTTGNVTRRHRGPKRKLRAGYRVPSLQRTSYGLLREASSTFSPSSVISHAFSAAMRVFDLRASSSPLKAIFVPDLVSVASSIAGLKNRVLNQSINQSLFHSLTNNHPVTHSHCLFDVPGTEPFASE